MKDPDKLRHEVSQIDRKMLREKLSLKGIPIETLDQGVRRGNLSLNLSLVMFGITGRATVFWQAPGLYETTGEEIKKETSA